VRGEVLPVGGVTQKVEAAIEAGLKTVLVPESNAGDIVLDEEKRKRIRIVPVSNLFELLDHSLAPGKGRQALLAKIKKEFG